MKIDGKNPYNCFTIIGVKHNYRHNTLFNRIIRIKIIFVVHVMNYS